MALTLAQAVSDYGRRLRDEVDAVAREQTGLMRDDIIEEWPVDTGASRAAWQGPTKVGYAHYRLRNDISYAWIIEYGGYPGVGPKTQRVGSQVLPGGIAVAGGIFPKQKPAAPVRRALSKRIVPFNQALMQAVRQAA